MFTAVNARNSRVFSRGDLSDEGINTVARDVMGRTRPISLRAAVLRSDDVHSTS